MTASLASPAERARELRDLLLECSPIIESYTQQVCPSCTSVCCQQKHGELTAADRSYLASLGKPVPPHDPGWPPDGMCQFLGERGCTKERWQRAWKCTWYFCEPLLAALHEGPPRKARMLSALLERIGRLYDELQ